MSGTFFWGDLPHLLQYYCQRGDLRLRAFCLRWLSKHLAWREKGMSPVQVGVVTVVIRELSNGNDEQNGNEGRSCPDANSRPNGGNVEELHGWQSQDGSEEKEESPKIFVCLSWQRCRMDVLAERCNFCTAGVSTWLRRRLRILASSNRLCIFFIYSFPLVVFSSIVFIGFFLPTVVFSFLFFRCATGLCVPFCTLKGCNMISRSFKQSSFVFCPCDNFSVLTSNFKREKRKRKRSRIHAGHEHILCWLLGTFVCLIAWVLQSCVSWLVLSFLNIFILNI